MAGKKQKWWLEKNGGWYNRLPAHSPSMVVRCPTHNPDGTPIGDDDIRGCGSDNVGWDGDVYDCYECCIFFSDYAADPPHRREEDPVNEKVREFLLSERDGCHGESERRAVAEFVLDAMSGNEDADGPTPYELADYLAEAATELANKLKTIYPGERSES